MDDRCAFIFSRYALLSNFEEQHLKGMLEGIRKGLVKTAAFDDTLALIPAGFPIHFHMLTKVQPVATPDSVTAVTTRALFREIPHRLKPRSYDFHETSRKVDDERYASEFFFRRMGFRRFCFVGPEGVRRLELPESCSDWTDKAHEWKPRPQVIKAPCARQLQSIFQPG